jgi:hypothetical protein
MRYSFEQVTVACFATGLVFGLLVFLVTQHQMNLKHASEYNELVEEKTVLEGRVSSLSNVISGLQLKAETVDLQKVRVKAITGFVDSLFEQSIVEDEFCMTLEDWEEAKRLMQRGDREADE